MVRVGNGGTLKDCNIENLETLKPESGNQPRHCLISNLRFIAPEIRDITP
jgi:hypothetical protein